MRRVGVIAAAALVLALAGAGAALAAGSLVKHATRTVAVRAGAVRTLRVPFPDALKYGNALYLGAVALSWSGGGPSPDLAEVRILEAHSVEGGSLYEVRVRNANAAGSLAVRVTVTATTVEPLPHS
ncbi:MAG TPA: hypothetical protein VHX66_08435 [Solirubrobacteraceae bacterium]|jgi:hypothetical protein|nr:hypothetical protein [Solirubrobacteraceae bacterium]